MRWFRYLRNLNSCLSEELSVDSIRLMFSIVDVDATPEFEPEEGAAEEEETSLPAYPIRCSVAITKVSVVLGFETSSLFSPRTCLCAMGLIEFFHSHSLSSSLRRVLYRLRFRVA